MASKHAPSGMRMKDLVAATGQPRSTILHYLAEGLLPKPLSTGRNMAYYDPACVNRVRLIRHLQSHKRLSLAEIREYLARVQTPGDLEALAALGDTVFDGQAAGPRLSRAELLTGSGLTEDQLSRVLDASLLIPQSDDGFDQQDLAIAKVLARSLAMGLGVEDFLHYPRIAEELVERDFALRQRLTRSLPVGQDAKLTAELARAARLARSYIFERVFQRRVAALPWLKG